MKVRILVSFLCISVCLSSACFSLPVELDTWKNPHQSKDENFNKNFDEDDVNEIEENRNFYLSTYLGINEYTSNNLTTVDGITIVHDIPLSLSLGYSVKDNFRVDIEGVIQHVKVDISNTIKNVVSSPLSKSAYYVISNVYYNTNIGDTKFAPYISIGGGARTCNSHSSLVIQGKLGINYQLTNKLQLSTGYRLLISGVSGGDYDYFRANNIEIGLVFNF